MIHNNNPLTSIYSCYQTKKRILIYSISLLSLHILPVQICSMIESNVNQTLEQTGTKKILQNGHTEEDQNDKDAFGLYLFGELVHKNKRTIYMIHQPHGLDFRHKVNTVNYILKLLGDFENNQPSFFNIMHKHMQAPTSSSLYSEINCKNVFYQNRAMAFIRKLDAKVKLYIAYFPGSELFVKPDTALHSLNFPTNVFTHQYSLGIHGQIIETGMNIITVPENTLGEKLGIASKDNILLLGELAMVLQDKWQQFTDYISKIDRKVNILEDKSRDMKCCLYKANETLVLDFLIIPAGNIFLLIDNIEGMLDDIFDDESTKQMMNIGYDTENKKAFFLLSKKPISDSDFRWDGICKHGMLLEKQDGKLLFCCPDLYVQKSEREQYRLNQLKPQTKTISNHIKNTQLNNNINLIQIKCLPDPLLVDKDHSIYFPELIKIIKNLQNSSGIILDLRKLGLDTYLTVEKYIQVIYILKQLLPKDTPYLSNTGLIYGEDIHAFDIACGMQMVQPSNINNCMYFLIHHDVTINNYAKKKFEGTIKKKQIPTDKYINHWHKDVGYRLKLQDILNFIPRDHDVDLPEIVLLVDETTKGEGELLAHLLSDHHVLSLGRSTYGACTLYEEKKLLTKVSDLGSIDWIQNTSDMSTGRNGNMIFKTAKPEICYKKIFAQILHTSKFKNTSIYASHLENKPFIPDKYYNKPYQKNGIDTCVSNAWKYLVRQALKTK